jgi:hypothetical protein
MSLPKKYRIRVVKYKRTPKKVVDNTDNGPKAYVGQSPRPSNLDDYSCWTDRSAPGARDNDSRGPMDTIDPEKPQGM